MVELVVARYNEDTAWTNHVPQGTSVIVYNKGDGSRGIALPNIGREAHTYLTHIVCAYNSLLAETTFFCQGDPFSHEPRLHMRLGEPVDRFRWLGIKKSSDTSDGSLFSKWEKNVHGDALDMDAFWLQMFSPPSPASYEFYPGAIFAATADAIRARPVEFWERALHLSQEFPNAAHCFERVWGEIFKQP